MLIPVHGHIRLSYENDDFNSSFELKLFFIKIMPDKKGRRNKKDKQDKPDDSAKPKKEKGQVIRLINIATDNIDRIKKLLKSFFGYLCKRFIKVKKLIIHGTIGVDDAMYTALLFGGISGFIYTLCGIADSNMRLGRTDIDIKPDFDNEHISLFFEARLATNVFHVFAIIAVTARHGIPLMINIRKYKL